jgi:hypothetical protein
MSDKKSAMPCSQMLGAIRIPSDMEGSIYPGLHPHQPLISRYLGIFSLVECLGRGIGMGAAR